MAFFERQASASRRLFCDEPVSKRDPYADVDLLAEADELMASGELLCEELEELFAATTSLNVSGCACEAFLKPVRWIDGPSSPMLVGTPAGATLKPASCRVDAIPYRSASDTCVS